VKLLLVVGARFTLLRIRYVVNLGLTFAFARIFRQVQFYQLGLANVGWVVVVGKGLACVGVVLDSQTFFT
jgi:tryptophan-rich sensory protein